MALDTSDFGSGRLASSLAIATTTGVTLQMNRINGAYVTPPSGIFFLYLYRKAGSDIFVEKLKVAAGTSFNSTTGVATLGTLTRNISLTNGSDSSGSSATRVWPSGTLAYIGIGSEITELAALINQTNTFASAQTFAAPVIVSGTSSYVKLPELTSVQRDALTPGEGMLIKNSTTNTVQKYEGGSWQSVASGSTPNMDTTTAGKGELGTVTDAKAATGNGDSGAPVLVPTSICKVASAGAADDGKVVIRGTDGLIDTSTLGTGAASGSTVLKGDKTWGSISGTNYIKQLFFNSTTVTLTNPTVATDFGTHQYTFAANTLNADTGIEAFVALEVTDAAAAGTVFKVVLGGTVIASVAGPSSSSIPVILRVRIQGTAASGASVEVRSISEIKHGTNAGQVLYSANNLATNGTLLLKYQASFNTTNASNTATIRFSEARTFSVTAS